MTLSGLRVRDAGPAGAGAAEEPPGAGKAPGIPACCPAAGSGTTPPSRLPAPANPRRGVAT